MASGHETRDFTQVLRDLFRREHASRCLVQGCHFGPDGRCVYCDQVRPSGAPGSADTSNTVSQRAAVRASLEFPAYQCSMSLEHNPHKVAFQTVAQWLAALDAESGPAWPSPEERQRAIDTNEMWLLTWYPHTAVRFQWAAASSLDSVLKCARAQAT
jgi:hypothetical protein